MEERGDWKQSFNEKEESSFSSSFWNGQRKRAWGGKYAPVCFDKSGGGRKNKKPPVSLDEKESISLSLSGRGVLRTRKVSTCKNTS